MNIIEESYKLRLYCLSAERVFSDDFLLTLFYHVESDEDKDIYLDILNTEFRGDIPDKFIEVILKWLEKVYKMLIQLL